MAEVFEATRPDRPRDRHRRRAFSRKEDDRLLRGEGRFADDVDPGHCLHMAVGRCPFPHARIVSIDVSAALALEGVEDVLVGADVVRRSDPLSVLRPVPNAPSLDFYAMATDVALFEGHPVVSVVAVSRARGRGRGRPDRHRLRAAPARVRRRVGDGPAVAGAPPDGCSSPICSSAI